MQSLRATKLYCSWCRGWARGLLGRAPQSCTDARSNAWPSTAPLRWQCSWTRPSATLLCSGATLSRCTVAWPHRGSSRLRSAERLDERRDDHEGSSRLARLSSEPQASACRWSSEHSRAAGTAVAEERAVPGSGQSGASRVADRARAAAACGVHRHGDYCCDDRAVDRRAAVLGAARCGACLEPLRSEPTAEMHTALSSVHPAVSALPFPPKKVFGTLSFKDVEERREALQAYLQRLVQAVCGTRRLTKTEIIMVWRATPRMTLSGAGAAAPCGGHADDGRAGGRVRRRRVTCA